jgi:hypothetical protein
MFALTSDLGAGKLVSVHIVFLEHSVSAPVLWVRVVCFEPTVDSPRGLELGSQPCI